MLGKPPRTLDRLEEFCNIARRPINERDIELSPAIPFDGPYVSLIPTMKAWILGGFSSEDKLSQSLDPYCLQRGTESKALSPEDMMYVESPRMSSELGGRADKRNQNRIEPV